MEKNILKGNLKIINIGLKSFTEAFEGKDKGKGSVASWAHVDFRPPLISDASLFKIIDHRREQIEAANKEAMRRIFSGRPFLVSVSRAIDVIPGMQPNSIFHAGPPVDWENMCGPMKGAIIGALLYEKIARNAEEAEILAAKKGSIKFSPCHEHKAVGPMAGIISPSMPVFVVKNEEFNTFAYATMNEGLGKVLRYGAYDEGVIAKLRWMEDILYPVMKRTVEAMAGKIDLKSIISQALHMGDEVHNRNRAATSLLYRQLAPLICKVSNADDAFAVLNFINGNDHFFLNLSMAAAKSMLDVANGIKYSSIVTVMARNGTEFGIKVAGLDSNLWFTGKAPIPDALFFPGYSKEDANPDIGDSAITETLGVGGFAMASAPSIVQFVGGNVSDALKFTLSMYEITSSENSAFQIPYLNFRGAPAGIDIIKVIEKNILPVINTGVAHKLAGIGQVGAGVLNAPTEPFKKAFLKFVETIK
ncbi:MAG: DUF1116 domain-containing protein [Oligoflexia bacterium]|nr:DUF1116 domain-containing protein [Oligoflexia bacterium]